MEVMPTTTHQIAEALEREQRNAHCKVYIEPTVKKAIQEFADREGMTFSEAGRELWLDAMKRLVK
jgi:hypothetical protein